MLIVMIIEASLYKSCVFILHCDLYEQVAVNLKQLCLLYIFINEVPHLLRYQVYTRVNVKHIFCQSWVPPEFLFSAP